MEGNFSHLSEISYELIGAVLSVQQLLDVSLTEGLGPLQDGALKERGEERL